MSLVSEVVGGATSTNFWQEQKTNTIINTNIDSTNIESINLDINTFINTIEKNSRRENSKEIDSNNDLEDLEDNIEDKEYLNSTKSSSKGSLYSI